MSSSEPEPTVPECCRTGYAWQGAPTGSVGKVAGLDCYMAKAGESKADKAIVIVHDIFGWTFPNARLIADAIAKEGYDVYLPDFFNGTVVDPDALSAIDGKFEGIWTSVTRGVKLMLNAPKAIYAIAGHGKSAAVGLDQVLDELRGKYSKIGAAGYCFGGRQLIMLAQRDTAGSKCDAYMVAHPGEVIKVPQDLQFPKPVLYVLAEKEFFSPYDPKQIASVLEGYNKDGKVALSRYWPGTNHGFATRVNEAIPELKQARDEALEATIGFFKSNL
ncbi:dienelactone hydrolase [Hyaloraphidium curvatum]|nr:dienelactone hydrolase [Hyaloraphidium curvatum]